MSKTQWPEDQPSNGVSIGGLLCKNGKLYKSSTRSNYLCEWGVKKANVVNKLSETVAICRTDYPGTENMVIQPLLEVVVLLSLPLLIKVLITLGEVVLLLLNITSTMPVFLGKMVVFGVLQVPVLVTGLH